ncbi:nucleotidyltransferase domain-containing protein [Rhizobium leguminosarum]|uniref:nucleotidyltransferase domain-containing protein n=1 Tax=Rhizobium leguminosarum TaxID=384 RepID=UPI0010302F06|nr:nucleotidyltransferase domain-containing protein [Rhizobium leguminosarum]TAY98658.1 nucleotidyltransferase domain-containing protein [Rhizobium leguminosarum]TAZ09423.1 nucleotidyltransferase domain-containing protein [Rhizobium leguminosarum]
MGIEAIFLYGSWARGDQGERSDKDLLMVTDEEKGYHVTDGVNSMTYYPLSSLKSKALLGDLFIYHIVLEAKCVLDPNNVLSLLRKTFKPKESYFAETRHGGDLGWYLVHHHLSLPLGLVAKRIAWSVRTVLIARSATRGRPVFSPENLVSLSDFEDTDILIASRHGNFSNGALRALRSFLEFEKFPDPLGPEAGDVLWRRHFAETSNYVGIQLLKKSSEESLSSPYGET